MLIPEYPYVYVWRKKLPQHTGKRCRIIKQPGRYFTLSTNVVFEDGTECTVDSRGLRRRDRMAERERKVKCKKI